MRHVENLCRAGCRADVWPRTADVPALANQKAAESANDPIMSKVRPLTVNTSKRYVSQLGGQGARNAEEAKSGAVYRATTPARALKA